MKKSLIGLAFLVVAFVFCSCSETSAMQPASLGGFKDVKEFPKGKRGEVLTKFLKLINQGENDSIYAFLEKHYTSGYLQAASKERHLEYLLAMRLNIGKMNFYSTRYYDDPNTLALILNDRVFGSWKSYLIRFNGNDQITEVLPGNAREPKEVVHKSISQSSLIDTISDMFNVGEQEAIFSGTILIAKGDSVLFHKAYGEASKRFHVANNTSTKFNLGSMNKMMTSVSVMQLVEKGTVSLNDPISKFIDESWLPKSISERITITHLLQHTSGLGSYFTPKFSNASKEAFREIKDYKKLVIGSELAFNPGERYQYSNIGMLLLGVVVEKASQMNYFTYVNENIYKRAQMVNSGAFEMDQPVENLAVGYARVSTKGMAWRNNYFKNVIKGGPAGGGYSTTMDLFKFSRALQKGELLSNKSLDVLWTKQAKANYGAGFEVCEVAGKKIVGHSGGFVGVSANMDVFLESGYTVVILSNHNEGASAPLHVIRDLIVSIKD